MTFNVLLVLVVVVVFVATLVYIFLDQRGARASQPPTISTPPATPPAIAAAMTASPRRATSAVQSSPNQGEPRLAATDSSSSARPSPQSSTLGPQSLTASGRLRGVSAPRRTQSQPIVTTNPNAVNPADGLTAAARRDLDQLGGGIGGELATNADIAPPITRRVPTTQPPIKPAMPARRTRSATYPALEATATDTVLRTRTMPNPPDAIEASFAAQPGNPALLTEPTTLSTPTQYGRVFRKVTPEVEEDEDYPNFLPESRANLPNRLILEEENNDRAPLLLIGGLAITLLLIVGLGWLFIAPLFNSDKDKAPAAQFYIVVAHFGANDGTASQEFGNLIASDLKAAGLDASQAAVLCCVAVLADDAAAAAQASHYNADLVIWGDLPNAAATALAPHYHLAVNNPPSLTQRQGLPSLMMNPAGFSFAPVSRANLEPALADFSTGLALYYSDRVADASDRFASALARGLDTPALHFYRASSLLQLGDNNGALAEYAKAGGVDDLALLTDQGLAEQMQGNLATAQSDDDKALKALGNDSRASIVYRNRAQVHLALQQPDLAIADLTLAIAADPRNAPAWYERCTLKFDVNADPLPTAPQAASAALSDCNNALTTDPQYPAALIQRGALWLTAPSNNLDNAQADIAAARDLLTSRLNLLRADEARFKEKNDRQSDVSVRREVEANQQLGLAHYWMGRAYIERGKIEAQQGKGLFDFLKGPGGYDKAIDEFNAALITDANSYDVYAWLGVAQLGKGDSNSAAAEFQQAQKIDSRRPLAYQQLASLYHDANQHDKAAAEYEGLLQVNPGYIYGYLQLAAEYNALNQSDKAANSYRRATAQHPGSGDEFRYVGIAADNLQDYANAIVNYQQAVAHNASDGRAWFNLGEDYRKTGQNEQAIAAYQKAAAASVSADVASYRAATLANQLGQTATAVKLWQQTIQANPQFMLAYYHLAQVAQNTPGHDDDAIKYYEQSVRGDPNTAADEDVSAGQAVYDAHLQLGNLYHARATTISDPQLRAAAWKRAEDEYTAAVQTANGLGESGKELTSANSLCAVYLKEGNTDFAVTIGDQMINVDKNYAPAYVCKGQAYLQSENSANLPSAADNMKQAVALDPNNLDALVGLGRVYQAQGQTDLAEPQFRQAIAVAPQAAAAHVALGDLLCDRQQWANAQQEYTTAVQFDSRSATGYSGLARTLAAQGNSGEAEKDFRYASQLDPTLADPHLYLGQLLAGENQSDTALTEYQAAVQLRPRWWLAQYQLGKADIARNRISEAITALTQATQLNPQSADAFYSLGNADRAAGSDHRGDAINAYKNAVAINPNLAAAWFSLGLTDEESGDQNGARDAYDHAVATATDPDLKRQAQDGLARVGGG